MEVEEDGTSGTTPALCDHWSSADMPLVADKNEQVEEKEAEHADGASSHSLSIPIPASLQSIAPASMLPTPPPTPPLDSAFDCDYTTFRPQSSAENKRAAREQLFFHLLGVSGDIQGFDYDGHLILGFGSDAEESTSGTDTSTG